MTRELRVEDFVDLDAPHLREDPEAREFVRTTMERAVVAMAREEQEAAVVFDPWRSNVENAVASIQRLWETWPEDGHALTALRATLRFLADRMEESYGFVLPMPSSIDLLRQEREQQAAEAEDWDE